MLLIYYHITNHTTIGETLRSKHSKENIKMKELIKGTVVVYKNAPSEQIIVNLA